MESTLPAGVRWRWAAAAVAVLGTTVAGTAWLFERAPLAFATACAFATPLVLAAGVFTTRWSYRALTGHRTTAERGAPGARLGRSLLEREPPTG